MGTGFRCTILLIVFAVSFNRFGACQRQQHFESEDSAEENIERALRSTDVFNWDRAQLVKMLASAKNPFGIVKRPKDRNMITGAELLGMIVNEAALRRGENEKVRFVNRVGNVG